MKPDETRETVSKAYAEAVARVAERSAGCCASPTSAITDAAGYEKERATFESAADASFGCGNPLAFAEVQPGQVVVDLGSGAGLDLLIASEKVGPRGKVIGVDMTDKMIAVAQKHVGEAGATNVEIRKGLIEELPVDSGSVDWVISNCVINLSPEKSRVFSEVHRVLRPGGRFAISDIVARDLPPWVVAHASALVGCVAGAISEEEYVEGLRRAGLEDVEVGERLVYTADQMEALISGELTGKVDCAVIRRAVVEIEGKVWSARVTGARPIRTR